MPPSPRSSPAVKMALPALSVLAVPSTSLFLASRVRLTSPSGLGRGERAGKHGEPAVAGIGGEPDVGDHEPLAGASSPIPACRRAARRQKIDPGLALRQCLVDRKRGGDLLVELTGNLELALPDRRAELIGHRLDVVIVELAQELRPGEQAGVETTQQRLNARPGALRLGAERPVSVAPVGDLGTSSVPARARSGPGSRLVPAARH